MHHESGFMTSTGYNYCGKFKKVWNNVDTITMIIEKIRGKASDVVDDEDTIYYMKDGVTLDKRYQSLTSDEQILELARVSKFTGVVKLHVYHTCQGPSLWAIITESEKERIVCSEGVSNVGDSREGEICL